MHASFINLKYVTEMSTGESRAATVSNHNSNGLEIVEWSKIMLVCWSGQNTKIYKNTHSVGCAMKIKQWKLKVV